MRVGRGGERSLAERRGAVGSASGADASTWSGSTTFGAEYKFRGSGVLATLGGWTLSNLGVMSTLGGLARSLVGISLGCLGSGTAEA
jgi:hypothetical protein